MSSERVGEGRAGPSVALNTLDGTVVTQLHRSQHRQDPLEFLSEVGENTPKGPDPHVALDGLRALSWTGFLKTFQWGLRGRIDLGHPEVSIRTQSD